MDNATKIIKALLIVGLLFVFFHPIAAILFLVAHLGIIVTIGVIYIGLRLFLGASLLSFIARSMNNDKNDIQKQ